MNLFSNNLTFAVVIGDMSWHADLTIRFCEYLSNKINADFMGKIIFPSSIDEAISKCTTDYLLIQSDGNIIYNISFLEQLEQIACQQSDIIVGFIELAEDYAILNPKCLFVNIELWKKANKPGYVSKIREGNTFTYDGDNRKPSTIKALSKKTFIEHSATLLGSGLISKQLEIYGLATSLSSITTNNESFYLDSSTPFLEIYTETFFEQLLKNTTKKVFTNSNTVESELTFVIDTLIVPAEGLRAYALCQHFKPKRVIIYDVNQDALKLQHLIFSIEHSQTYGEILNKFKEDNLSVELEQVNNIDKHRVVSKTNFDIEFYSVDVFSYKMIELVKSIDATNSVLFDYSDIFVYPFNYFKKPLYLVNALFIELYSLMKSRQGPTYIFGYAPGWINMNNVETNTSTQHYRINELIDLTVPEENRIPIKQEDIMFIPKNDEVKIPDKSIGFSLMSSLKNIISKPHPSVKETSDKKDALSSDASAEEMMMYFQYVTEDENVYKKTVKLDDFIAIYSYSMNGKIWSFKVSKQGNPKQVEFSNGINLESLRKHLYLEQKINSKTALRYFQ